MKTRSQVPVEFSSRQFYNLGMSSSRKFFNNKRFAKRKPTNLNQRETSRQSLIDFARQNGPYNGWKYYFDDQPFMEQSNRHLHIYAMESFIQRHLNEFKIDQIVEKRFCTLDVTLVTADALLMEMWNSFKEDLTNEPEHTLACLGMAMHHVCFEHQEKQARQQLVASGIRINETILSTIKLDIPHIRIRPVNCEPILPLKQLKVNYFGKLITIQGTCIRAGQTKLIAKKIPFICDACAITQTVIQIDGAHTLPAKCTETCRSKRFTADYVDKQLVETLDWQLIKVQETLANHQIEGGRVPRMVEIELTSDLVDSCVPGDNVTITGIVKVHQNDKNQTSNTYSMYIEAIALVNDKLTTGNKSTNGGIEFAVKDYYAIQDIHNHPDLVKLLVHSLCPQIYGHEIIKLALLLGLFSGGIQCDDTRADPHILMVGDPGLGKSQLLQACTQVAPRGVYVCGNTSTSAGLTVTLTREAGGDFALDAGALVLADQGICCIDEFDKMSTQHQALLEAMEQQTISIAKAGVVCTLRARCGILAAANPVGGHYNRDKTVCENIRLNPSLLSRFDIVFLLLDKPDEGLDSLLSEHVLNLHSNCANRIIIRANSHDSASNAKNFSDNPSLSSRLQLDRNERIEAIPAQLLRKYIAYARRYVRPRLEAAAASVLQQFYLNLRKTHQTFDSTPITSRQLQALIRLTQARAKLELRECATESDAREVVELMGHSLIDVFSDQHGQMHFDRSQNGSGMSSRGQIKKFLAHLQTMAQDRGGVFDESALKTMAESCRIAAGDVMNVISTLNVQGFLMKSGNKQYKLVTI